MKHTDAREAVLARMAESRAELVAAHAVDKPASITRVPREFPMRQTLPTPRPAPWLLRTPNAELIALALVAATILGLRRTVQTAVGAGLSASVHRGVGEMLEALRK